jgi:molybdopterin-guanine dinucleotide biosynthesis protein A
MWQRQREILSGAGVSEIFLSARADQTWARSADVFAGVIHDRLPGCGPIVGITAAIERATHPLLAVVAVDLPAITLEWFESLLGECTDDTGVIGRRGEFFEPLAAIYPARFRWVLWEAVARAEYSLQKVIQTAVAERMLRVREIGAEEAGMFANWNEPGPRVA